MILFIYNDWCFKQNENVPGLTSLRFENLTMSHNIA